MLLDVFFGFLSFSFEAQCAVIHAFRQEIINFGFIFFTGHIEVSNGFRFRGSRRIDSIKSRRQNGLHG